MDYYKIKKKNMYAGNGHGRQTEIIYGEGVSEILGAMSRGFFNLLSKKSAEELGKKALKEVGNVAKDKAIDLATKGATKLTEKAFGSIENKVLGKKNKKEMEEAPRTNVSTAEKKVSRKRIRDIMAAERKRLLAEQNIGSGLTQLGKERKVGNGLRRLGRK